MMIKSNTLYDILKYIAQIVLPATATLYFALSQIWGLPYGAEVVGTIAAIDTFLGVLLGLSAKAYNESDVKFDGTVDVIEDEETKNFILNIDGDPYELDQKEEVVLRVNKVSK